LISKILKLITYLDSVGLLDIGVGETDGSSIVSDDVRDLVLADLLFGHLAKLVASLLGVDSVGHEATLDVVENTEVLASLGDGNDVLESEGEARISSDSVVNLDIGILVSADLEALLAGECVLKSVFEKDGERNALSELVGAR